MCTKVHVYQGDSQLIIDKGNFNLPLTNHIGLRQQLGSKHAKLQGIGGSFFFARSSRHLRSVLRVCSSAHVKKCHATFKI
jgi:hypothetical protein